MLKRLKDNLEKEKVLMADVKDWEPGYSVYNTKRWVPPTANELFEIWTRDRIECTFNGALLDVISLL